MKKIIFLLGLATFFGLFYVAKLIKEPLIITSLESKRSDGGNVYNRIKFVAGLKKDVWLMQQSHSGINDDYKKWDRLAIVVDKMRRPFKASFYQFKPGPLKMGEAQEKAPYKVSCLSCHSNGPRAIRAKSPSMIDRLKIELLNLRIKTYFLTQSEAGQKDSDDAPFSRKHPALKEELKFESCNKCHGKNKIRNALTFEQLSTAKFLVENKHMPPWPFSILNRDKEEILGWHNKTPSPPNGPLK